MTSEVYEVSKQLLDIQDVCRIAQKICDKYGFDVKKDYHQTVDSDVMKSPARRQMYVHQTATLFKRAIFLGATEQEVLRIATYLLTLMESVDHALDYKKCALDMDIPTLERKYSKKDFLDLDVNGETLKRTLSAIKELYEVSTT